MRVGGRNFNQDKTDVELAMGGEPPEEIRKYFVEINGQAYPPKQVLAKVTGWERQTFTTMEAQRVLTKLGFVCREGASLADGRGAWTTTPGKGAASSERPSGGATIDKSIVDRLLRLEAALVTAQEAIAGLSARVRVLEEGSG